MKVRVGLAIGLVFLVVGVLARDADSQKPAAKQLRGVADIPFDFFTLDSKMPAGRYSVTTVGPTHLLVRNEKDPGIAAEVFTSPDPGEPVDNKDAKLIFIEREGKTYLVAIINSDGQQRITGLYGETRKDGDVRKEVPLIYP